MPPCCSCKFVVAYCYCCCKSFSNYRGLTMARRHAAAARGVRAAAVVTDASEESSVSSPNSSGSEDNRVSPAIQPAAFTLTATAGAPTDAQAPSISQQLNLVQAVERAYGVINTENAYNKNIFEYLEHANYRRTQYRFSTCTCVLCRFPTRNSHTKLNAITLRPLFHPDTCGKSGIQ